MQSGKGGYSTAQAPCAPRVQKPPDQNGELTLAEYLEEGYLLDSALSFPVIQEIVSRGNVSWEASNEDGQPVLHLAAMNEATPPEMLFEIITFLLANGAPVHLKDEDGETALQAVMSLAENEEDEAIPESTKMIHMASIRALLSAPGHRPSPEELALVLSWLRRNISADIHEEMLSFLTKLLEEEEVKAAWASEMLLEYLEKCAYNNKKGVQASRVRSFLEQGAKPGHKQRQATSLLLVVLPHQLLTIVYSSVHL